MMFTRIDRHYQTNKLDIIISYDANSAWVGRPVQMMTNESKHSAWQLDPWAEVYTVEFSSKPLPVVSTLIFAVRVYSSYS
jgi:hypothetical protein